MVAVATEVDERDNKIRSTLTIYQLGTDAPVYPTIVGASIAGDDSGPYIPFSALSGLASDNPPGIDGDENILYSVEDSFYQSSRMFVIDASSTPAVITAGINIVDTDGVLAAALGSLSGDLFVNTTASPRVNEDGTVNLDLEGIAKSVDGGFWLVSEGSGTMGDEARPYQFPNMLLKVTDGGVITEVVFLPEALNMVQLRFGFEGVAEDGDHVVIAMQRAWNGEPNARLAIYKKSTQEFSFVFYPLDTPVSQYGGWVGLSDISPLGNGQFLVLERDNQGGPDSVIKKLYSIDLGDFSSGVAADAVPPTITKTEVADLVPIVEGLTKARSVEKFEGCAVTQAGRVFVNNDNDGVDDNSGEQIFLDLGEIVATSTPAPTPMPTNATPLPTPVPTDADTPEPTDATPGPTDANTPEPTDATPAPTEGSSSRSSVSLVAMVLPIVSVVWIL